MYTPCEVTNSLYILHDNRQMQLRDFWSAFIHSSEEQQRLILTKSIINTHAVCSQPVRRTSLAILQSGDIYVSACDTWTAYETVHGLATTYKTHNLTLQVSTHQSQLLPGLEVGEKSACMELCHFPPLSFFISISSFCVPSLTWESLHQIQLEGLGESCEPASQRASCSLADKWFLVDSRLKITLRVIDKFQQQFLQMSCRWQMYWWTEWDSLKCAWHTIYTAKCYIWIISIN